MAGIQEVELDIQGMSCAACVRRVQKALEKTPGVEQANVNFATHTASIQGAGLNADALIGAIRSAGYDAAPHRQLLQEKPVSMAGFWLAFSFTLPVFVISMFWHDRPVWANALVAAMATPVILWSGRQFHIGAFKALRSLTSTMDSLVSMGSLSAWGYSIYSLVVHWIHPHELSEHVYFETGAVIVTLILLGRTLEARAKQRMTEAVRKLMELTPDTAILVEGAVEREVPTAALLPGAHVRVRPGARIPADGEVLEGESYVDQSMLTGEPVPVLCSRGSQVSGGTLNGDGALLMKATRLGADSTVARLARMVERAQGTRAPLQSMADRISSFFVPMVFVFAVITVFIHLSTFSYPEEAFLHAVAVLVVACPCALGLATPTALIVGVGRAAEMGILIKDGEALERAGRVRTVFLDKTGTLTQGSPSVTVFQAGGSWSEDEALQAAASLEASSSHPLARSIVQLAESRGLQLTAAEGVREERGKGASGMLHGRELVVGSPRYVGLELAQIEELEQSAHTVVAARRGSDWAVFGIQDPLRASAGSAVRALEELGVEPVLLTGDNARTAAAIAQASGIREIISQALPEDKIAAIERRQETQMTAMVGDGINDAPALAKADLGIAMGGGAAIALEAAGVTILGSDLGHIATAIRLSRATIRTIRWNLVWAFLYNVLMIPLAAFGGLSPMLAAGAMALSSLSVVANSLRLRRFR